MLDMALLVASERLPESSMASVGARWITVPIIPVSIQVSFLTLASPPREDTDATSDGGRDCGRESKDL